MSTSTSKDTIYIDAEDDITVIIDKVRGSNAKVIALVLPKRATTLQSVVNLKLLKRTTQEVKKNIVLITSEAGLLPIAGAVGMHVAKTLQSKPSIPVSPEAHHGTAASENETLDAPNVALDPQASIGQLAGHVATEETIELDNEALADSEAATKNENVKSEKPLNKKLKIPNFDRFRLFLFGGIALLVLLIVGGIFAFIVLPKATITIQTDTTNVNTTLNVTAKVATKTVDASLLAIPAIKKEVKKSEAEKTPATGQRDEGTKATGTMTVTNCSSDTVTLAAGTIFGTNGVNFVSNEPITVPKSSYDPTPGGFVCNKNGFKNVEVTAQTPGGSSNLSSRAYQIQNGPADVTALGSNMSGGTSKLVQIVSQQDIDKAKQKLVDRLTASANAEIKAQFATENTRPLTETFAADAPVVTSTPNVNDPAADVSVSVTINFTQLSVKNDDLKMLVESDVKKKIDISKQTIQDNGLSKATITLLENKSPNEAKFEIKTLAVAGPQLDGDGIKRQVAGKKRSEASNIIKERPGIRDVTITYSPFWVYSTPKNVKNIIVNFEQADASN